jgi:N-acetyl-anhydromuramyl-L-alanine amidase AmpD
LTTSEGWLTQPAFAAVDGQELKQVAAQQTPISNRRSADPAQLYSHVVERYARLFDNPVARLRFLNNTLAKQAVRQEELRQSLQRFRFLENTRFYEWVLEARLYSAILEEMRAVMTTVSPAQRARMEKLEVPFKARLLFFCYEARHAMYAVGVLLGGVVLFGLYSLVMWSGQQASAYFSQKYGKQGPIVVTTNVAPSATPPVSKALNRYDAEKVWLVERAEKYERYSNGGRINTEHEIDNHPRAYYLIPRNAEAAAETVSSAPVGIVYHTTEGEQIKFSADNNSSIQERSKNLIKYTIQKNRSYNYLIDRFGEIFRVVRDEQTANHAGNSLWADQKHVYIGLNESFIGVAFESQQNNTLEETLTAAQVSSGYQLTAILRSKYKIEDANCTTHGLVSVNPDTGVIAFHHDWAKNFPFEAMGLSDKYKVPTPNMTDYGFTWDEEILEKLNKTLWPGALTGEEEFKRRAEKQRIGVEALRLKLRDRYKDIYARQKALQTPVTQTAKLTEPTESDR